METGVEIEVEDSAGDIRGYPGLFNNIQSKPSKIMDYKSIGMQSTLPYHGILESFEKQSCVKKLTLNEFVREKLDSKIVGVYIWYSRVRGGEGVGHITVGFGEHYVSFWPIRPQEMLDEKKSTLDEFEGYWEKRRGDANNEQRPPDYVANICGLDTQKMQEKFEEIQSIVPKWHLLASTPFKKLGSLNCIAVAIEVLRAGGIEDLADEKIIREINGDLNSCQKGLRLTLLALCFFSYGVSAVFALLFLASGSNPWVREQITDKIPLPVKYAAIPFLTIFTALICYQKFCCKSDKPIHPSTLAMAALLLAAPEASDDISTAAKNILEIPYESLRGLIEHTFVPDGRIEEIINKAVLNGKNKSESLVESELTPLNQIHFGS